MHRMQGVDTTFFQAETPTMHLHVIGVMVLDPASAPDGWGYDTVVRLLAERIHLLPPFRWRAVTVPGDLDAPRWIEDPDFCLEDHVHRAVLPAPADAAAMARFVGRIAGIPLDRERPLWEMHVIERLEDGSAVIVTKLHHSFMDGGAGADVMASLFDLTPEGDAVAPPERPWAPDAVPSPVRLLAESLGGAFDLAGKVPGVVVRTAAGAIESAQARRRCPTPATDRLGPATPLNGALTAERVVAFAHCPLADVKHAKAAFGVTVNDVVLAAATAALRAELLALEALPDRPLIAMVPISERAADDADFSNRTTVVQVALPVQIEDPVERLRSVHQLALDAKVRHQARGNGMTEDWAAVLPPALVRLGALAYTSSGAARFLPPLFNLVVSNIPGPPIPLYLGGALVTALYPMGPLLEGGGLNLTVLSHTDMLDIGVMACPAMVTDPDRVADGFVAAVHELLHLAQATPVGVEGTTVNDDSWKPRSSSPA